MRWIPLVVITLFALGTAAVLWRMPEIARLDPDQGFDPDQGAPDARRYALYEQTSSDPRKRISQGMLSERKILAVLRQHGPQIALTARFNLSRRVDRYLASHYVLLVQTEDASLRLRNDVQRR